MTAIITLTTDFGLADNFVGVMKGVILKINGAAKLVDLTHEIRPFDLASAAFALGSAYRFFPDDTVHLAVVDPGVGSARSILAVRAAGQFFIAPDNGLLSSILEEAPGFEARRVEEPDFWIHPVSRTFQGRDIMAPVAAHLSLGVKLARLGPLAEDIVRLPRPKVQSGPGRILGRVIYVDRFGNLITNIPEELAVRVEGRSPVVKVGGLTVTGFSRAYADRAPGEPLAVFGGSGNLEIARFQARAEAPPDLAAGTPVTLEWSPDREE
ncbi:MAG: SAM-dependent chlorinase/fluorinase [Pseudomonadota bacterium]